MHPTVKAARIAGLTYLLLGVVGPVRLIYIPSVVMVRGNPSATANNIVAHESLFRIGILSDLLTGLFALLVTFALYRLFKAVDQNLAIAMVILGSLMVTPIYFLNTLNDAAALMLARGMDFTAPFNQAQREALAMLFLRLHHHGVVINEIFWGLWLLPFGLLVIRSGFLPRFLGVWLIINCFAYLATSFTGLLFPQYEERVSNLLFPALFGEVAIMLWLVIRGARVQPVTAAAG